MASGNRDLASGHLLGIDVGDRLEITQCFPLPTSISDEDPYEMEMFHLLEEVSVDAYHAGFYQAVCLNNYFSRDMIQSQYTYQLANCNRVFIVFDPYKSRQGKLSLKAYRLTYDFMLMHAQGKTTPKAFVKAGVDSTSIFEEVPIRVRSSHHAHAFLYELRDSGAMDSSAERLSFTGVDDTIERAVHNMTGPEGAFQELIGEQQQFSVLSRRAAAQKAELQRQIDAIEEENITRRALGKEPKPLPDITSAQSKYQEPSRLDSLLAAAKVDAFSSDLSTLAEQTYLKQSIMRGLVRAPQSASTATPSSSSSSSSPTPQ